MIWSEINWFSMNIYLSYWNIIRLFAFLCFYAAISYGIIAWKYLIFFKITKTLRPLLVFTHLFIVISNIIGFLTFVLVDGHVPLSIPLSLVGLLVAITGSGFLIWAILKLRIATFIPPTNRQLITNGPYRVTSHPMYFGGVVAGFGLALWHASTLSLVYALVIMLSLIIISKEEEKDLIGRFGSDYLEYKKITLLAKMFALLIDLRRR